MKTTFLNELSEKARVKLASSNDSLKSKKANNTVAFYLNQITEGGLAEMFTADKCWIEDNGEKFELTFDQIMEISMNLFTKKEKPGRYTEFYLKNDKIVEKRLDSTFAGRLEDTIVINQSGIVVYNTIKRSAIKYIKGAVVVRTEYGTILYHNFSGVSVIFKSKKVTVKAINITLAMLDEDSGLYRVLNGLGRLTVLSNQNGVDIIEQMTAGTFLRKSFKYKLNQTLVLDNEGYPCWTSGKPGMFNYSMATRLMDSSRPKIYCSAKTSTYYEFKDGKLKPVGTKGTLAEAKAIMPRMH